MQSLHILHLPTPRVPGSFADAATRLFARALAAWHRQRLHRATVETLHSLDDRTLRDLGFHRSELGAVVAELGEVAETTYLRLQAVWPQRA